VAVSPSGWTVPENLLRISIRFDAAPEGQVLRRLSLATRDGRPLHEPFLDQELWSPDGRVLSVLLHPGRVKTGLIAYEQLGAILAEGETVQLMLDGQPLWRAGWWARATSRGRARTAGGSRRCGPGIAIRWVVRLDGPIDARGAGYVAVVDSRHRCVAGRPELLEGERVWRFTPAKAWSGGLYQLVARGTLEDPAGNRLNSRFERDADQPPGTGRGRGDPLRGHPRR
jgi:hypothetical protein